MHATIRTLFAPHTSLANTRTWRTLVNGHTGPLLLLVGIACCLLLFRAAYVPLAYNSDTGQYIETARLFSGDTTAMPHGNRLLKPLAPLAMVLLAPYTGDLTVALALLSALGYLLLVPIVYAFLYTLLHQRNEAFIGTLLYLGSYPLLFYGLDLYTETGAWLFHLIGLLYAARYFLVEASYRSVALSSLATTLGFLWKEYTVLSGLALVLCILLTRIPMRTKLAHLAVSALIALPVLIGWQLYVYATYGYTYLDWFLTGHGEPDATSQYSPFYVLKSLFALMLLGWGLIALGLARWHTFTRDERTVIAICGITSCGFLSWGYVSSRLYFVLAPVLALFAGRGSTLLPRWARYACLLLVLAVALAWLIVSTRPEVRAWLSAL